MYVYIDSNNRRVLPCFDVLMPLC